LPFAIGLVSRRAILRVCEAVGESMAKGKT
jgi:hypothetical protein